MAMRLTPHKRQFVIARRTFAPSERWKNRPLGDGYVLSYDESLEVRQTSADPISLVLGIVVPVAHAHEPLSESSGRFVEVCWPRIALDAGGLLAVYYHRGADGNIATSSPAIAQLMTGAPEVDRKLRWEGQALNWAPSPGSPLIGVSRLLADEVLDVRTGTLSGADRDLSARDLDEGRAIDQLASGLVSYFRRVDGRYDRFMLALTGGLDSRTLFGAAREAGLRFEAYTSVIDNPRSHVDASIASEIAKRYGVRHHVIRSRRYSAARAQSFYQHTLRSFSDADDNVLVPCDHYAMFREDDALIRACIFGLGRRYFAKTFDGCGVTWENVTSANLLSMMDEPEHDVVSETLDQYLEYRKARPLGTDLVDTFYFDQLVGGWTAAIEQGMDAFDGTSLQPINSLPFMRCLLQGDPEGRAGGPIQRGVVRRLDATLMDWPVNPPPLPPRSLRDRARDMVIGTPLEGVARRVKRLLG